MPNPLAVTIEEITRLDEDQSRLLIRMLLKNFAQSKGIPEGSISISDNKYAADGGLDGRIAWSEDPLPVIDEYIPDRLCGLQFKATPMGPTACRKELFGDKAEKKMKDGVKEIFEKKGTYILFCSKNDVNDSERKSRIKKMREGLPQKYKKGKIEIFDAGKLCTFTNRYPSCAAYVKECLGKPHGGFRSVGAILHKYGGEFITDDKRKEIIGTLRSVTGGAGRIKRVVGLPMIGKTRIVLEALRQSADESEFNLQAVNAVYIDVLEHEGSSPSIPELVRSWISDSKEGIILVDGCSNDLHIRLKTEIESLGSKFSLVTIAENAGEEERDNIVIQQLAPEASIAIAKNIIPNASEAILRQIAETADGFPSLVEDISTEYLNNPGGHITDLKESVLKKLLGKENHSNEEILQVSRILAAFDQLQVDTQNGHCEAEIVLKELGYDITIISFRSALKKLGKLVVQRGGYARLIPPPLAAMLAKQFYETVGTDKIASFYAKVDILGRAKTAMSSRLSNLGIFNEGKEIVQSLTEPNRPFGNAEVLFTNMGSRLFCSFVEVNPSSCLIALKRILENTSKEVLESQYHSVFFLIEALKKLCVHERFFFDAAPLLLYFAKVEKTNWNNGAKRHFYQLFHIVIPGTEVALEKRFAVIDEITKKIARDEEHFIIEALGEALNNSTFTGSGNIQMQSGRFAIEEYHPRTYDEVRKYFRDALNRLMEYVRERSELSVMARHEIASHFRDLFRIGMLQDIIDIVRENISLTGSYWPEASGRLQDIINFDLDENSASERDALLQLQKELIPSDLPERMRIFVTDSPWWDPDPKMVGNAIEDEGDRRATEFAKEVAHRYEEFIQHLDILFSGQQARGFAFGKALGECVENRKSFIEASLSVMKRLPPETLDLSVIEGFLRSIQKSEPHFVEEFLEEIANTDDLVKYLIPLSSSILMEKEDLTRLLNALAMGKINVSTFNVLSYGAPLTHLTPTVVLEFVKEIRTYDKEGIPVAFVILYMYCLHDIGKKEKCMPEFIEMLSIPGVISNDYRDSNRLGYDVGEIAKEILKTKGHDAIAKNLVAEIIELSTSYRALHSMDFALKPLVRILFEDYRELVWSLFKMAMDKNYSLFSFLVEDRDDGEKFGVLFDLPSEMIIKWAKEGSKEIRLWLARKMPLVKVAGGTSESHPFATAFIEEFGDDEFVQGELNSNIHAFGWMGSPIPKYLARRNFLSELANKAKTGAWAREQIIYIDKEIENENIRNSRQAIGIYE